MALVYSSAEKQAFSKELRTRLEEGSDLPVMPEIANQLLMLRNKPSADVTDLVAIVEKDPVVSSQLLRFARMSIFGYGDRIKTISDAVQLVLGYEKALHQAIGLSIGRSMMIELGGPLGLRAFWNHSLKSAVLTQALAKQLPSDKKCNEGVSYLVGLIQDIGFLLLGELYPDVFSRLNKMVHSYDSKRLRELEYHFMGVSHDMVGSALLRNWDLPEEIIVAVREHNFSDYDGEHAIYAKLINLSNQLLLLVDDYKEISLLEDAYSELGLDADAVDKSLESVRAVEADMNQMVDELVAA